MWDAAHFFPSCCKSKRGASPDSPCPGSLDLLLSAACARGAAWCWAAPTGAHKAGHPLQPGWLHHSYFCFSTPILHFAVCLTQLNPGAAAKHAKPLDISLYAYAYTHMHIYIYAYTYITSSFWSVQQTNLAPCSVTRSLDLTQGKPRAHTEAEQGRGQIQAPLGAPVRALFSPGTLLCSQPRCLQHLLLSAKAVRLNANSSTAFKVLIFKSKEGRRRKRRARPSQACVGGLGLIETPPAKRLESPSSPSPAFLPSSAGTQNQIK